MHTRATAKVREFSDQAKFKDPSRSVVLADVLCSSNLCSSARDIDMCREYDVIESVTRTANGGVETTMRCHTCAIEYDMDMLEQRLVQMLHQVNMCVHIRVRVHVCAHACTHTSHTHITRTHAHIWTRMRAHTHHGKCVC